LNTGSLNYGIWEPQSLIHKLEAHKETIQQHEIPDAVFVPFRQRSMHVNSLLRELKDYKGPIFLMPSNNDDLIGIAWERTQNVQLLYSDEHDYLAFFKSLTTSSEKYRIYNSPLWDLPIKRNYAIYFSKEKSYEKILLVDDDIRNINIDVLHRGCWCLDKYIISGCFVEDFPDTSIVGHVELLLGINHQRFLSGSFLFVKPKNVIGFFPVIYNEDWLFMLPHIPHKSICSFGSIAQVSYDPFQNLERPKFQEFGEIIVENLYGLTQKNDYGCRYDERVWASAIESRRTYLQTIRGLLSEPKHRGVIDAALEMNRLINPSICKSFVEDWESDIIRWKSFLQVA